MGFSYYASKLSDNIGETPEGFLVCRDAIIARTGFQSYEVRDLPAEAAKELGVNLGNPGGTVQVYRSPDEVFSPATIASFEGKSVTDGHPPSSQFVDPTNISDLEHGHVQNVRKGEQSLDSGEWPLIADVIIKREPLISRVRDGRIRELSCGYDYELALDGEVLAQTGIRGNHVAVVPKGRAGAEARINDSAPDQQERKLAGTGSTGESRKEKVPVKITLKHLLGLGLKAFAADANPEELAEAVQAVKGNEKPEPEPEPKPETKPKPEAEEKPAADNKVQPVPADDRRARLHAALDRMLDECAPAQDEAEAEDVDIDELRELLDEFFEEEEEEPQHGEEGEEVAADCRADDMEAFVGPDGGVHPIRGSKGYKRSAAGEGRKKRRARDQFIEPVETEAAPATADALAFLRDLRPIVARSKDAAVKQAFNNALRKHQGSSRPSEGGYGDFAAATRRRASDSDRAENPNARLQAAYDAMRTGKSQEVK